MSYIRKYVDLTPEQIAAAQHADIAEYLISIGEKVIREGNHVLWKKHDSCVISDYKWYQNSTGEYGAAVYFLQHFFGMSFPEAVLELTKGQTFFTPIEKISKSGTGSAFETKKKSREKVSDHSPLDFALPEKASDHRRLFAYLTISRCISPEIVTEFLQDKLIYQDVNGNVVFVCYDRNGFPRAAHKRGTSTEKQFRGFVTGGDFNYGFSYVCESSKNLYVFEAAIDLMSYISLHRHEPWFKNNYLSLGGLSDETLKKFLQEYPQIENIAFCLDNDYAKPVNYGQRAAKRYAVEYGKKRRTIVCTPKQKDWNEVLKIKELNK